MKKIVVVLSITFILLGCNDQRSQHNNNQTPDALKEKDGSVLSYKRSGNINLIEGLFAEAQKKDTLLRSLMEEYRRLTEVKFLDSTKMFTDFYQNNNKYYESARIYSGTINDTILEVSILKKVTESHDNIQIKVQYLKRLDTLIQQRNAALADQVVLLKIKTTLKMMEDYQEKNLPNNSSMENLLKEMEVLQKKLEGLVSHK